MEGCWEIRHGGVLGNSTWRGVGKFDMEGCWEIRHGGVLGNSTWRGVGKFDMEGCWEIAIVKSAANKRVAIVLATKSYIYRRIRRRSRI